MTRSRSLNSFLCALTVALSGIFGGVSAACPSTGAAATVAAVSPSWIVFVRLRIPIVCANDHLPSARSGLGQTAAAVDGGTVDGTGGSVASGSHRVKRDPVPG